jgi:hypothetical protein
MSHCNARLGQCSGVTPELIRLTVGGGATDNGAMTSRGTALPLSLDPLMAEAKRRMRRRRVMLALLILLVGGAGLTLALRPSGGGPSPTRPVQQAQSPQGLRHITVPVDSYERTWRARIESGTGPALSRSAAVLLRRKVVRAVRRSGATVLRIRVWRRAAPMSVEVVLATAMSPATYLRDRLEGLVGLLAHGNPYVKVVGPRGSRLFEWYYSPGQGMVGVPHALQMCSPVSASWMNPEPCPAS